MNMLIDNITARALHIPFKVAFVHASATRAATQSIWATASAEGGVAGVGEGCPREYVTSESVATALAFVTAHQGDLQASISDVATLARWVELHRSEIDAHPAAWAAVELALLDLIGQVEGRTVESLLGVPQLAGRFRYTAILGDAAPAAFEAQLGTYVGAGFRDFKVKLCGDLERDRAKVRALLAAGISEATIRADANNLWADVDRAVRYLDALDFRFSALEEPLRAGDFAGMRRMSQALDTRIILDESLLRAEQLDEIRADAHRWIANVRVSKMGGLLRSLQVGVAARANGVPIIVGAHVGETSVLTRAALVVANSLRDCVVASEGAFGTHLLEHDVVDPSIMFGRNGIVDSAVQRIGTAPGLGLATGDSVTEASARV
jgi:L-Ala-D/L-Glu epimerase / N-acetyl-D-glutamate racemase